MPELPEVEINRRYFDQHALGQRIVGVRVKDLRILGESREPALRRTMTGRRFVSTRRHGKHLFAEIEDRGWLRIHFGMTGDLFYYHGVKSPSRHPRVIIDFEQKAHLSYDDPRLFGVVELAASPESYIETRRLGPDPLDKAFDARSFSALFENRKGAVKALLMTQEIIAGLGNLYVDEMLFQTSVHPRKTASAITRPKRKAMYKSMRTILCDVIDQKLQGKSYPKRYLIPYRQGGERCPRCGGTIQRTVVFGRTTYFCGTHQRT